MEQSPGLYRDLQIFNMWKLQTDTIIYVRVTDTDAKIYISCTLDNVLEIQDNKNKSKYLLLRMDQRKMFTHFSALADSLFGSET